ncbi:MAG: phosphoethanolamine transferase [Rubrivivax sp.]|nr:phosphoethanolamine transferase [Rubrivivax sp.]
MTRPALRLPASAGLLVIGVLLMIPSLVFLARGVDLAFSARAALQSAVFLLLLLYAIGNVRVALLLTLPFALLVPAETYFITTYGYPSSRHVLGLLSESSPGEVREFLSGIAVWLALACGLVLAGYAWLWRKAVPSAAFALRWRALAAASLIAIPGFVEVARTLPAAPEDLRKLSFANAYPLGLPYRVASHFKHTASSRQVAADIERFRFNARIQQASAVNIVFVIGESARPDHWQLHGYGRPTNPRLSRREGVVWLPDMISPWALTTYSTPIMITRKPALGSGFFPERSVLAAMREAGFEVHWLANQDGLTELNLHRDDAQHRKLFNLAVEREDVDAAHDAAMLDDVRSALARPNERKFLLVHTKGSHWDYHLRYPDSFRQFLPDRSDTGGSVKHDPRQRDRLVNAYDNSILYTDHLLDEVIAALQATGRPSALVYVSDHGQALYEDGCGVFGHFNDTEANFRVAALLWLSPELQALRAEAMTALKSHRGRSLSTELTVFHTLADLAGLNVADPVHSLLNPGFMPGTRWVNTSLGAVPFDGSSRVGACRYVRSSTTVAEQSAPATRP